MPQPTHVNDVGVVRDLWTQNECIWDKARVRDLYGDKMARRICKLPLLQNGPKDRIIWFYDPHGIYNTKSGYSWLVLRKVGLGPHRLFWRLIWKLNLPLSLRFLCGGLCITFFRLMVRLLLSTLIITSFSLGVTVEWRLSFMLLGTVTMRKLF